MQASLSRSTAAPPGLAFPTRQEPRAPHPSSTCGMRKSWEKSLPVPQLGLTLCQPPLPLCWHQHQPLQPRPSGAFWKPWGSG